MPMNPVSRARLLLVVAALLFATGGPAIKACDLSGWQVSCLRSFVAGWTLLILMRPAASSFSWRSLAVGLPHGATMVLFAASNKLTTAAHAIFLQNSSILYVLMLAPLLLRERLRRHDAAVLVLVIGGLALFFAAEQGAEATAPNPKLGNLLAAASGLTWALTVVGLRWLSADRSASESERHDPALAAALFGNAFACLASVAPAWPLPAIDATTGAWIVYLGVVQIGVAYACVTRGMRGVTALEASVILLIEPVINPLLTWWFHSERPHPWAIAGGMAILAASMLKAWWGRAGRALER